MKFFKSGFFYIAIILVIIGILNPEVEARRKILRGRKTITRTYYRKAAIPSWSIVLIVGLCMVVVGAGVYGILHRIVLKSDKGSYGPAPIRDSVHA